MLAFDFGSTVTVPITWASLVAVLIPFVTALITKFRGSNKVVQIVVAVVLTALLAVWAALTDDMPTDTVLSCLSVFLGVLLPELATYLTAGKALDIDARMAPQVGI